MYAIRSYYEAPKPLSLRRKLVTLGVVAVLTGGVFSWFASAQPDGVITSYSIHYTKLYDQESGQERLNVQARVNADIQMSYFVELAYIDLEVTGVDKQVWGTSTIGYDKDDGYNISTRLNTLPEPMRATGGTFDQNIV